jgi:hypothetical protein
MQDNSLDIFDIVTIGAGIGKGLMALGEALLTKVESLIGASVVAAAEVTGESLLTAARSIGEAGRSSGVRTIGSAEELAQEYANLSKGGTPVNAPNYNGTMVKFPDGSRVGMRNTSASGGATIDVFTGNASVKVHVK